MMINTWFNKASIGALVWIVLVTATGWVAGVQSLAGWLMVAVLAFGPPSVLLYFAQGFPLTLSQAVHRARR